MTEDPDGENAESAGAAPATARFLPIATRHLKIAAYGLVVAWLCYLLVATRGWAWEDRLFPQLVGGIGLVLAATILGTLVFERQFRGVSALLRTRPDRDARDRLAATYRNTIRPASDRSRRERETQALAVVGWTVALPIGMYALGFLTAIPLFVAAFDVASHRRPGRAIAVGLGFTAVVYLFFVVLLGAHMWQGVIDVWSILG